MVSPALETAASQTRTEDQFREERAGHLGAKYTPGPWKAGKQLRDGSFTITAPAATVFRCCPFHTSERNAEANARLIAAAPELLEALQALVEHGTDSPGHLAAEAAIRKARLS